MGTDANEWWRGSEYIQAYAARQEEMPDFVIDVQEIEGFQIGELGWGRDTDVDVLRG